MATGQGQRTGGLRLLLTDSSPTQQSSPLSSLSSCSTSLFSSIDESPPEPPSRSPSPEVFYINGRPIRAAQGSPRLHPHHFVPYDIGVNFGEVNWGQKKSKIDKEEPVSPGTRIPEDLSPLSPSIPGQSKRKSDDDENWEDLKGSGAAPSPKKKPKYVSRPQVLKRTTGKDSDSAVDTYTARGMYSGTLRRSPRLIAKAMKNEKEAGRTNSGYTDSEGESPGRLKSSKTKQASSHKRTIGDHGGPKKKYIFLRLGTSPHVG